MKVLLVHWHPEPASFNCTLFQTALTSLTAQGHEVRASNLQALAFDANSGRHNFTSTKDGAYFKQQLEEGWASEHNAFAPEIETEIAKLEWCDTMIWVFPLWWFSLPAVLKGWVDRVFVYGRCYGNGKFYEAGVFCGKRALLCLTTGGAAAAYEPGGFNGDMNGVLRPIHRGILGFTGFGVLAPHVVYGPVRMSVEERENELAKWQARLATLADEQPIVVGHY